MPKGEKIFATGTVAVTPKENGVDITITAQAATEKDVTQALTTVASAVVEALTHDKKSPSESTSTSHQVKWGAGTAWGRDKKNRPN